MTTETITDYETKEVEREVTYSDLSGREIPDGDKVSLVVNPLMKKNKLCHQLKMALINSEFSPEVAEKRTKETIRNLDTLHYGYEGKIDLHIDELAELNGIDPDDIDADSELPEWYVKRESPEVVERPWISSADIGPVAWWFGMSFIGLNMAWILTAAHLWPKPVGDMVTLLVIASAIYSIVGLWGLVEIRENDCW